MRAVRCALNGNCRLFLAWVGLNENQGQCLNFCLFVPEQASDAHHQAWQRAWDRFVAETKPIENEPDYFKAHGQDLQLGYTNYRFADQQAQVFAEKRRNDGQVQLVIVPLTTEASFAAATFQEGRLATQWNHGAPVFKVGGQWNIRKGNSTTTLESVVSVLIQEVDEFSVNNEEAQDKGWQLIQPVKETEVG